MVDLTVTDAIGMTEAEETGKFPQKQKKDYLFLLGQIVFFVWNALVIPTILLSFY